VRDVALMTMASGHARPCAHFDTAGIVALIEAQNRDEA